MTITKKRLSAHLQNELGLSKREAQKIISRLFDILSDTLSQGEDLLISGFGKFSVKQKNSRRGRNPQTGKSLLLPARKVLVFRASGVLRRRLHQGVNNT